MTSRRKSLMDFIEDRIANGQSPRPDNMILRVGSRFEKCSTVQSAEDRVDQRVTSFADDLDRQNLFWPWQLGQRGEVEKEGHPEQGGQPGGYTTEYREKGGKLLVK
jgi:hypothetical protein